MIPHREILELRGEWHLRDDVIEKDYALGWLLAGIAAQPELAKTWVFKGGTCLRKCYFETYRFSEDLDFTIVDSGPETPDDLMPIFARIRDWLFEQAGLEIVVDQRSFDIRQNRRGNATTLGRIAFRGPSNPPTLPKVKLDLTSDELLAHPTQPRPILHPYSDRNEIAPLRISSYSIAELLAEKLRALAERCRPRDLYDAVHVQRHPDLLADAAPVLDALQRKCAYVGIEVPDRDSILTSPLGGELDQEWANMLAHQLPHLPPVDDFWSALDDVFAWLHGEPKRVPERAPAMGSDEAHWTPPQAMTSWRVRAPLELIRFAGANRLKVELDYRPATGRQGPRVVEPYSLRRSRNRDLLLYVVNDRGKLRSYRLDKIAGARIVDEPFRPRYLVEF